MYSDEGQSRDLAMKAGHVSLRERLQNLAHFRQGPLGSLSFDDGDSGARKTVQREKYLPPGNRQTAQFATLQEFFQSKSSFMGDSRVDSDKFRTRQTKIPIMKLTKDDWNVKCWEERLNMGKRNDSSGKLASQKRRDKRQLEVFQGRIEEVANKLDKVREGEPLDEELAKLLRIRQRPAMAAPNLSNERGAENEREWIRILKEELTTGTHNSRVLRQQVNEQLTSADRARRVSDNSEPAKLTDSQTLASGVSADRVDENGYDKRKERDRAYLVRSPHLGRPIRRLFEDDDEDEDDH